MRPLPDSCSHNRVSEARRIVIVSNTSHIHCPLAISPSLSSLVFRLALLHRYLVCVRPPYLTIQLTVTRTVVSTSVVHSPHLVF